MCDNHWNGLTFLIMGPVHRINLTSAMFCFLFWWNVIYHLKYFMETLWRCFKSSRVYHVHHIWSRKSHLYFYLCLLKGGKGPREIYSNYSLKINNLFKKDKDFSKKKKTDEKMWAFMSWHDYFKSLKLMYIFFFLYWLKSYTYIIATFDYLSKDNNKADLFFFFLCKNYV